MQLDFTDMKSMLKIIQRRVFERKRNSERRRRLWQVAACVAVVVFTGCASDEARDTGLNMNVKATRPGRILVHDFAATVEDVSIEAPLAARLATRSVATPEQITMERQLCADMSGRLIQAIREMGLPAEHARAGVMPQMNDVVIRGYLVSLHETNALKRFTIGLESGATEVTAAVESFQVTPQGYGRSLGSGAGTPAEKALADAVGADANPAGYIVVNGMKGVDDANSRTKIEGWGRQAVTEIADRLKVRFQEQGWIN